MFFFCTSVDRLIVWAKQRGKQEGKTTLSKYTTVCEMNSCITLHLHWQIRQHWWSQQNCVLSNNYFWREQEFSFSLTHSIVGTPYCILGCMVEPDKSDFSTIEWYVFALQILEEYSDCSLIEKPFSWRSMAFVQQQNKDSDRTSISRFFTKSWQTEANSVPKAQLLCQAPQSLFVHKANLILGDDQNLRWKQYM